MAETKTRTEADIQKEIEKLRQSNTSMEQYYRTHDYGGKSLMGQQAPPIRENWKKIQALEKEIKGIPQREKEAKQAELEAEAKAAVEEAKAKQEASKVSALGYYDKAAGDIATSKTAAQGYYQPFADEIAEMPRELIDPAMREEMEATRRTQLGAYGQNLAGQFGDAGSGVQSGKRAEIGMGIAGMQADLPIELQLEIAEKNRQSQLGVIGAGMNVAGAQAGVEGQYAGMGLGVASGKAGVETAYQYDPGLEYIKSLGYSQGYQNTLGSTGGGTTTTTSGGSMRTSTAPRSGGGLPPQPKFGTGLKKMGVVNGKFVQQGTW